MSGLEQLSSNCGGVCMVGGGIKSVKKTGGCGGLCVGGSVKSKKLSKKGGCGGLCVGGCLKCSKKSHKGGSVTPLDSSFYGNELKGYMKGGSITPQDNSFFGGELKGYVMSGGGENNKDVKECTKLLHQYGGNVTPFDPVFFGVDMDNYYKSSQLGGSGGNLGLIHDKEYNRIRTPLLETRDMHRKRLDGIIQEMIRVNDVSDDMILEVLSYEKQMNKKSERYGLEGARKILASFYYRHPDYMTLKYPEKDNQTLRKYKPDFELQNMISNKLENEFNTSYQYAAKLNYINQFNSSEFKQNYTNKESNTILN